jgi:hypothetical protein
MLTRLAVIAALALPGCAIATPGPLTGAWGGDHLAATFTEAGATLQADCAEGAISGPVRPDAAGRFSASGAYHALHGGPQLVEEDAPAPAAAAARFEGRVHGETLMLTIRGPAGAAPQTFTLVRGARPKLVRCY